jgi:hypothetical protein
MVNKRFQSPGLQALYNRYIADDPERIASFEEAVAEAKADLMTFHIDEDQIPRLLAWQKEQHTKMLTLGGGKMPYTGAIGGVYTFSFTDSSIGRIVTCTNAVTGEQIDLSGEL